MKLEFLLFSRLALYTIMHFLNSKNWYFLCFALLFSGACFLALSSLPKKPDFHDYKPYQTIILHRHEGEEAEDEREELQKRQEWYERIHSAAPGVNWRLIDAQTRAERYQQILQYRKAGRMTKESFAGGKVEGEWREKGSQNLSGRVLLTELDVKNNTLYCASDGGNFWKGTPQGKDWKVLNDAQRFYGISLFRKIEESGKPVFLMAENGNVYRSTDECATWEPAKGIDGMKDGGNILRAVMQNNDTKNMAVLAFEWNRLSNSGRTTLYYSTNAGRSFRRIASYSNNPYAYGQNLDLWTDYYGNTPIYFINDGKFMVLDPSSGTPNEVSVINSAPKGVNLLTGVKKGDKTTIYAYTDASIYRSIDAGLTWELRSKTGRYPFFKTSFSCSYVNPDFVFFGDIECWKSTNAAKTWEKQNNWYDYYDDIEGALHADIPCVHPFVLPSGQEVYYINTDGGIFYSDNGLKTVQNISLDGLNISQYYSVYTNRNDSNYVYLGAQDQGFQRSTQDDGGVLKFDQIFSGDYGHLSSTDGGESLWAVYPGSVVYLKNARKGQPTASWDFTGEMSAWIPFLMASSSSSTQAFVAGGSLTSGKEESKIIKLSASGGSIKATAMSFDFKKACDGNVTALAYAPQNPDIWYAATSNGKFFVSLNKGSDWKLSSGGMPEPHYLYGSDILASAIDSGTVYVCGSGYSNAPVYRSTDFGQTFQDISAGLPATQVFAITANTDETLLFAATGVGPYMYVVEEDMWYDMLGSSAPDQEYWAVEYLSTSNTVRFATYGRGTWDFKISKQPERKKDDGGGEPTAMQDVKKLSERVNVFPNPAQEGAVLAVRWPNLSSGTPVWANLKDMVGRSVFQQNLKPIYASQELQLKLPNSLPKGVYLLEMVANKQRVVKRIQIE